MQRSRTLFTLRLSLVLGLIALSSQMQATVIITPATGGNNVSADKALNSTNGAAFTALGSIVITEGAATDFAPGNNQTLILTVPDGWQFNPGVGTVTFTGSRNITSATLSVTPSTLTVTFSVSGNTKLDALTIGGVQVQALDGANIPSAEYIRRRFENAGTALIAGIEDDFTTFGLLNQVAGAAKALVIQTQPPSIANVGTIFAPQPQVKVVDQFGNLRDLDNTTVLTAARAAGTGTLQGTVTRTATFGVASYTNLAMNVAGTITIQFTATNVTSATSGSIVVNPAPADRLVFTTQPGSANAGAPFGIQPVIRTADALGNFTTFGLADHQNVTLTLSSGGTLLGTTTLDIGTAAGNGTINFTDLQINTAATNSQITASGPGFANSSSSVFTVNPGTFTRLQLLMPGEIAAPGTLSGKTGAASAQVAGTPFNVTVNAVDAYWNVIKTAVDTVGIASSDSNAALPPNAALVNGTKVLSATLKTAGSATVTASDISNPSKSSSTSPSIAVNTAAFSKLQILAPGETAAPGTAVGKVGTPAAQTAGTSFNVVVKAVDANWNPIASINHIVGLTSSDANATLSANTALAGGTATLSVTPRTAGNSTVTASDITDSSKTSNTTPGIVVAAGPFARLQLLVPGESAAPGTATGKTGSPSQQMAGDTFSVIVNAVDANWNKIATVTDLVGLSSSDVAASLPANISLVAGTKNLSMALNTPGSATVTASDLSNGSKPASTSPAITVVVPLYTAATGGNPISADTTGGTFTTLTGPVYTEVASGNVGLGTIILKAPAGFIFDTALPLPTVLINGSGTKANNINGVVTGTAAAMTSVSTTQLVFTVTQKSTVAGKLTWQNVRVRPTAGTPLASGNLSFAGTASLVSVSPGSNFGLLREVPGAATKFAIQVQPSATATAGVPFAQQPVLQIRDKFDNLRTNDNSTLVTAARNAGSGTLQGTLNATAINGVATFSGLMHNVATNITLAFSASGLSGTNSSVIAVSPATADRLVFTTQPGSTTYGSALSIQPVLKTRDAFGNDSTVGLNASQIVSLTLSAGSGVLQGASALDIGTAAGNGTVTFSGLAVSQAGTGKQLNASATGLTSALSSPFAVNAATVTGSITANSKIYDGTTAASIASRALSGALPGDDVSLSGGSATFATKSVGTAKTVTASGLSLSGVNAANYQLASTSASTTANITTRSLTVSAAGVNKVYDRSTSATVTLSDNRIVGDVLTTTYSSASFADKNVGTAKTVSVSGISISGTDAPNYSANTTATTTANITARALTISAAGINKVYDSSTAATVTLSDNRLAGDVLTTSYTSASFADKNVGTAKIVTASGLNLAGTDAANYTFNNTASTTANITARSLTLIAAGVNKVYDRSTNATVTFSDNRVPGDVFTVSYIASFPSKTVGTNKTVSVSAMSLSGADAGNYQLTSTTSTTTANITARPLTISATGINKVYNGTTSATVTLSDDRVAGDSLTTSYTSASFADKNVGTSKTVSVSSISISGADAANYTANTTASTTANIAPATVTGSITATSKIYDGTTAASIASRSLSGALGSDDVSLSGGAATFASKTVGTAKIVTASGLSLSGVDAANYQLASTSASTTANITARSLTVSAAGINKVYNGTASATVTLSDSRVAGDSLTTSYTSASFTDKNVGTAKTVSVSGISISGVDAPNYSIANTTASTTANVTARPLIVSATGVNKAYDRTTTATVTLADDRVAGDSLTTSYSSASFADKNVGTAKTVTVSGIAISGVDAPNYSANTTASATANIAAKALTVSGITANNKIYDGTTSATLNTASAVLAGVISGDTVALNTASASAAFADKNVGVAKTVNVSALGLSGIDAGNYTVTQPTSSASISKAGLTITADDKSRAAGQPNPTFTASYSGFVGGETLATSGVSGSPALSSTTTNVVGTYSITAAQGTLSAANYSFSFVNGVLTVTPAVANRLVMLTEPSSSATAGAPFASQPAVAIQDAYGNLCSSDNSTLVTAVRNGGTGTLQGTLSATAINGVATFANLSHNVANTINLAFSSSGLTSVTSANISVSPAAFTRLQLLVPGETAAPGTLTGKTGSPSVQIAGTTFGVTVNAVDAFWNLINTVSDTVSLSSSDTTATLPPTTAMANGSANLTVAFNAAGNFTLTATDLTDGSKAATMSPTITVSPAQYTPATGGSTISADGATGIFTTLTGPTYSENASGNVGIGTIILKAPAGFIFDTGGTAPTVLLTRLTGTARNTANINGVASGTAMAMSSVTSTQLTFTVTVASSSGVTCKLTWQNVRVRPSAGAPLASGNLTRSGTASVIGLSTNANLGTLREVAGAASKLAIQSQPSATAVAGVAFAQQPVVQVRDQFGNLRTNDNSTVVTASRNAGSGVLQGTTSRTALNGLVSFTDLAHNIATNITLAFSAPGLTGTNSTIIAISPAAAGQLVFTTQPGSTIYGALLSPQPVLKSCDSFGNESTLGLGASKIVSVSLSAGSGNLLGTASLDIGTAAGNGTVSFSGLSVSLAGSGKQLSASATGLTSALSSTFAVNPAIVTGSITANSKIYDGTIAATIGTRSLTGVLGSDAVSLSGGTASFSSKTVGTAKPVTATGLSLSGADAGNYQLISTTASTTANITARPLTIGATGVNKAYDGTTNTTVTLSDNRVAGDVLTTSYTSASFANKNVGTAKTVSVSGISISGTDAANYSANTTASTTANITTRSLTVSATGVNKLYDGSTTATVTLSDNRLAGDVLTISYTNAVFPNKNVGTAKTVNVSGISISGTDAANYSANTSASGTADITAKGLTVSGITANNKVYDASTTATLNTGSAALVGVISGDTVSLNTASATGAFADKNVGSAKTVNVSALSLSGVDAPNYTLTQPTTSASISKAGLTVTADDKSRAVFQPNPTLTASYSGFVVGETLATSGVTGSPALSTTTTNVVGTYPITAAQGTLSSANYSFTVVNGVLTVTPASPSKLVILTQPSSTATAGLILAQQPQIRIEDPYGNLCTADNSTIVTAARNAGSGVLQGTLIATAVNGVATFANLSHNIADTISLTFSSSGLSNATSANIIVSPAAFTKLQLLVPGEIAAPGTANGKTGAPAAQIIDSSFAVTVKAVDNFWNLVNTVSDTVGLSSTDAAATLPSATALSAGTTNLMVIFNSAGSFTLTATDLTDGSKTASTSPTISVIPPQYTAATGGAAISADAAASGAFTTLTGPIYSENASGNVGTGTLILTAPAGFMFDTAGTAPTVLITRLTGSGSNSANINGVASGTAVPVTSRSANQIVFTVTSSSASGLTCRLTWQNVRVRPTDGTPLASGKLTCTGTANVIGMSTTANLGTLREVAGATCILMIETQPSAMATVRLPFSQQPVVLVLDQFGNLRNAANGVTTQTVVTAMRLGGSGILLGTTNMPSVNGVVSFFDLAHDVVTDIRVRFSAGSAMAISDLISVRNVPSGEEPPIVQPATLTGIQAGPNGIRISFTGSAGQTYRIQSAADLQLNGTIWTDIGSITTDALGQGQFIDTNAAPTHGFYRAVYFQ